jgi:Sec-independent protein secretion pathway component TatC
MNVKRYFYEIKNRLTLIFVLQISIVLSLYYYKIAMLFIIVTPILDISDSSINFIFTGVTEPISAYLIITYFINAQFLFLFILHQFFCFSSTGFYRLELKRISTFLKLVFLIWLLSTVVANLFLIPWSWLFFLDFYTTTYGIAFNTYLEFKLIEYLEFYISFHWANFLYFQFTGLLFSSISFRRTTIKLVRKSRKAVLFSFFCISALLCPDVVSQLIFVGVLIATYELHIVFQLLRFR